MSTDGDPQLGPLLGIAEELYGLTPAEFTGTRNEWAKQTKADGDAALAKRVTELRKPSTAAWVVNVLMRHQGEQMTQVLDLGASLRQAQADLDGDALRELARQRRQLTTAVTRQGRDLAKELGQKLTEAVADQVQGTLHAAMVDEAAAAAVKCGLLVTALTSTGVTSDADAYVDAVAVPEAIGRTARPRTKPSRAPVKRGLSVVPDIEPEVDREAEARAAALAEAQETVAAATADADEARKKVRKAGKRIDKVQAATLQTAEELEEAKRQVAELEHRLEQLDGEAVEADEKKERAEERYAAAQEALEEAQTALRNL